MNGGWGISYEITLRWMSLDRTEDKSTLVQVMAWCRQATSYYLSQCWPRSAWSVSPYGLIRPQWVKWIIMAVPGADVSDIHIRMLSTDFNTLRPRQNGRHFADDVFKCIFLNGNLWISIKISLKFVPKDPINNIPALVQIMAWRRTGDKPLSEPMMA